jgi:hypothetical protein
MTRSQLIQVFEATGNASGYQGFCKTPEYKISRGLYKLPTSMIEDTKVQMNISKRQRVPEPTPINSAVDTPKTAISLVPTTDPDFVAFGDYAIVHNLVKANSFFPVYITGESGNGKTKMVYEACAKAKRELIRANITEVTDEDDLIGGFRLVDGNTVWQDGPAIEAMKRGAVLLLDEINLGSPKIMCLQPILEGNPIYIKKTNELVYPAAGFTVVATANSKGKGSSDGRYMGSNILNEAFLDRFAITIEHDYPSTTVETKILNLILAKNNVTDKDTLEFVPRLIEWAAAIRNTFKECAIDEIVTTRRLIHILNFYIFGGTKNRMKAIEYCIARFDDETKVSFKSLYQKFDATIGIAQELPVESDVTFEPGEPTF